MKIMVVGQYPPPFHGSNVMPAVIFLYFLLNYDTFALVNLEAMRAGLPVISSSEGAIPEVVQDRVTGFIVNPRNPAEIADRILRLIHDRKLRERMGRAGRERFEEKYTIGAYVAHWDRALHFFNRLLRKK